MLPQWSLLVFLLALAGATISLERQAPGGDTPPSGPHVSFADKARQYFTAEELANGRAYARGRYLLYGVRMALTLGLFGLLTLSHCLQRFAISASQLRAGAYG